MLKVLIADDHEIVRRGLKQIFQEGFPLASIAEANDTTTLINKAVSDNWDIILSDLSMPGGGGLEAVREIRRQKVSTPILILSIDPEEQYALRLIKEGASGYLNKNTAPEELVTAVQRILSGRRYISEPIAELLRLSLCQANAKPVHELLSDREYGVFRMIVAGQSISAIAETLLIGTTTVSTYRSRILSKMNKNNNAELIKYAVENDLI